MAADADSPARTGLGAWIESEKLSPEWLDPETVFTFRGGSGAADAVAAGEAVFAPVAWVVGVAAALAVAAAVAAAVEDGAGAGSAGAAADADDSGNAGVGAAGAAADGVGSAVAVGAEGADLSSQAASRRTEAQTNQRERGRIALVLRRSGAGVNWNAIFPPVWLWPGGASTSFAGSFERRSRRGYLRFEGDP